MANNKVQLADGTVLIDISGDTVAANSMLAGVTAHKANGESVSGEIPLSSGIMNVEHEIFFDGANRGATTLGITSDRRICLEAGVQSKISLGTSTYFGDAPPSSVLKGATFSSNAGISVDGTLVVQRYYTGSSTPASYFGSDGDLYLKV